MTHDSAEFPLPKVEKSTILFDNFIRVREDRLRLPDGEHYDYYTVLTRPIAVMCIARTASGAYILNQEYRHSAGHILLGCPGGLVDPGEEPLQAAQRELLEETGYVANNWKQIGEAHPYPGLAAQKIVFFQAENAERLHETRLESAEFIRPITLSQEEMHKQLSSGNAIDGILCTALFFHQQEKNQPNS